MFSNDIREKVTQYKASNGVTYSVGDTIIFGRGSDANGNFKYLQMGGMYNTLSAMNGTYGDIGKSIGRNYSGLGVVIKKIKEYKLKGVKRTYFVVGGGNITNYNLLIEDALATSEVTDPSKTSNKPAAGSSDKYAKIKELKQLLDEEALTKKEFNQEKAKILSE